MTIAGKAGNSLDIGVQLGRYLATDTESEAHILAYVNTLVEAPCETAADALAVTAFAEGLMLEVVKMLQAGNPHPDLAEVAATAVLLCRKAIGALENTSGMAVEGFGGGINRPN